LLRKHWFLEHNGFLHNSQSGFRRNRSVIDHILRLQDQINKALKNKYHTLGVVLDFEKAFDLIWHNGLYIKLKNIGINGKLFEWIKDFSTNRTLQVRVGTQISDRFVLENGTAQGAIISPILFVIMINDLPNNTFSSVESSIYADDTAIFRTSKNVKVINSIINKNLQCIAE
jgi:hypothetical protein